MTLQPYPEYKDSGLPWLGRVPKHWDCLPHRAIFKEVKEQGHVDEQLLSVTIGKGIIRQEDLLADTSKKDSSNLDKSKYKLVEPGDIAYNKMRAWQGAVGASRYRGIVSPAYIVQRLRGESRPEYFHYLFRTPGFAKEAERWSYGITSDQWSLRPQHFKMVYSCVPPLDEQGLIVGFLRDFDRQVRRFIRNRRRLIEVLNEQKQAIINRAVTRGLDPDVSLKPSGIDWLGDIPEHWAIVPLRWYMRTGSGDFLDGQNIAAERSPAHPHPVIGGNGVLGYTSLVNCSEPTIVIGRVGALCGNVHLVESAAWITDNALRVSRIRCFSLDYLSLLLRTMNLNRLANANAQPLITGEMIKSQIGILPSEKDQQFIVKYVANATKDLIEAIIKAQREIDLIREYRTRLIADVVTGKVDVRHLAPAPGGEDLEEAVEELEPMENEAGELEDEALAGEVSRAD